MRVYVLAGSCSFEVGDKTFVLRAGASLEIPAGARHFATVGTHEVSLVKVFEMPPSHWGSAE
jgi:quercetin dioxygenase-like cupin family protein